MAVLSLKRDRNGAYRRVGHAIPLTTRANAAIFALELVDAGHSRGRASYASVQRFTLTYEHARNGLRDELADLALLALEPLPPSGPGRAQGTRVDAFLTTMCHRYPLLDLLEYQDLLLHCCGIFASSATLCRHFQRLVRRVAFPPLPPLPRAPRFPPPAPLAHPSLSVIRRPRTAHSPTHTQGLTMKKVSRMIADRLRGDIQRYKHELYFPMIRAIGDPLRLRFFDESGFQCKYLGRKRGRAPRGERLYLDIENPRARSGSVLGSCRRRRGGGGSEPCSPPRASSRTPG